MAGRRPEARRRAGRRPERRPQAGRWAARSEGGRMAARPPTPAEAGARGRRNAQDEQEARDPTCARHTDDGRTDNRDATARRGRTAGGARAIARAGPPQRCGIAITAGPVIFHLRRGIAEHRDGMTWGKICRRICRRICRTHGAATLRASVASEQERIRGNYPHGRLPLRKVCVILVNDCVCQLYSLWASKHGQSFHLQ